MRWENNLAYWTREGQKYSTIRIAEATPTTPHTTGVAFLNGDGSINVKLESLPVAGDFQIRDYVPREEGAGTNLRGKNGQGDDEAFAA